MSKHTPLELQIMARKLLSIKTDERYMQFVLLVAMRTGQTTHYVERAILAYARIGRYA